MTHLTLLVRQRIQAMLDLIFAGLFVPTCVVAAARATSALPPSPLAVDGDAGGRFEGGGDVGTSGGLVPGWKASACDLLEGRGESRVGGAPVDGIEGGFWWCGCGGDRMAAML